MQQLITQSTLTIVVEAVSSTDFNSTRQLTILSNSSGSNGLISPTITPLVSPASTLSSGITLVASSRLSMASCTPVFCKPWSLWSLLWSMSLVLTISDSTSVGAEMLANNSTTNYSRVGILSTVVYELIRKDVYSKCF